MLCTRARQPLFFSTIPMFRDRPQRFVDTPACRQPGSGPRKIKPIAKPSQRPRSTRSKSPDLSANRKFVQRNGNVCVNLEKIPVFDFSECPLSNRKKIRAVARYLFFPRSRNVVSHPLKSRQVEAVQIFHRRQDVVVSVVSVHGALSRLVHNVGV
jgi:hypothetical protein